MGSEEGHDRERIEMYGEKRNRNLVQKETGLIIQSKNSVNY
jgi:hypothetical protein